MPPSTLEVQLTELTGILDTAVNKVASRTIKGFHQDAEQI